MSSRRPGDWDCGLCQHHNFGFREACQQCGGTRSSSAAGGGWPRSLLPGDWFCACGAHNFANRLTCLSCAAAASSSAVSVVLGGGGLEDDDAQARRGVDYGGGGWKHGDWLCTRSGCNQHNFASRKECYRCRAPKGCGK